MKFLAASTALAFLGLSGLSSAAYSLTDNFVASNFFSQFDFKTGDDPTHGFVNYIDQGSAQSQGLVNTNNNKIYMGVDYKTMNPGGRGRNSVRIESKKQFTHGLFLLDLNHMPGSICGAWPAFWTYGPNWPVSGEIDILEGVNSQKSNWVTLHTNPVCKATPNAGFTGQLTSDDCASSGAGCSIHTSDTSNYGDGLNNIGGGVYALEWTSAGHKVWFFPRNRGIPSDISSGRPNPAGWGTPMANFPSNNCNIDQHFQNHWITFDTTFCGDWAGSQDVWNADATCRAKAPNCKAFVAANPGAFQQAYWDINSLKVYQNTGTAAVAGAPSSNPTKTAQPIASQIASSMASASSIKSQQPTIQPVSSKTTTTKVAPTQTQVDNDNDNDSYPGNKTDGKDRWNRDGSNHGWNRQNGRDHDKRSAHVHAHAHAHAARGRRVFKQF